MLSKSFLLLISLLTFRAAVSKGLENRKYAVKQLPNLTFQPPSSWAGEICIPGTKNELFFWLFAGETTKVNDNLIIWLNGGPGCSSLQGLTSENGPLSFIGNQTAPRANPYSWTKFGYVLYVDQPVGVGYSTGPNQTADNFDVTQGFIHWLKAFYAEFPELMTKTTYMTGESYAGVYIPYIADKILADGDLNITLKALVIGDGTLGNYAAMSDVVTTTYIRNHKHILAIPQNVIDVFDKADQQCGFKQALTQLTYPPNGTITIPGNPEGENFKLRKRQATADPRCNININVTSSAGLNQSIYGPCNYGCATFTSAVDFFTATRPCFSAYNIAWTCKTTPNDTNIVNYLNLPSVRTAIHAANKTWETCNSTILNTLSQEFVTPPAYRLLPDLLGRGVLVHLYSGDQDLLLNHFGTELVIQNMTWNGKQGFQHPPVNSFVVDGKYAGNWGRERGLSYHHILRAGHLVPHDQPAAAFAFLRDFVIGAGV